MPPKGKMIQVSEIDSMYSQGKPITTYLKVNLMKTITYFNISKLKKQTEKRSNLLGIQIGMQTFSYSVLLEFLTICWCKLFWFKKIFWEKKY